MAKSEDIFVSISPEIYRKSKSNLLEGQIDLLTVIKKLHNLKVLVRQKNDLKIRMHRLLTTISNQTESLQKKMPKPKVPRGIHIHTTFETKPKRSFSKGDEIEEELKLIKAKLQEINA